MFPTSSFTTKGQFSRGHPIENLIDENRKSFSKVLARQSKTLQQAVKEYRHRYGRAPPAGFDRWFEIAQENDFVLVDEFDTFMQSIEPYQGIHPVVLQQRIENSFSSAKLRDQVSLMFFNNQTVTYRGSDEDTRSLINDTWLDAIPYDMTIVLNNYDEPMVNAPWDEVERAVHAVNQHPRKHNSDEEEQLHPVKLLDISRQSGWAATRSGCSIDSPSRADVCPDRISTAALEFISNVAQSKDVCLNCEIKNEYGLMLSPEGLRIKTDLTPIWSASRPSHFNDILYPSPYYINTRSYYDERSDSAWEDKTSTFYWVGRTTGGYASREDWQKFQRQRLVLKTNNLNEEQIQLLEEDRPGSNKYTPRYSTMAEISDLFAVRMADVVQCTDEARKDQNEAFNITGEGRIDSIDAAYSHRFVLDIDGNGFSGRYYRLLKSRSVVVKSTIPKEWHDDFLFPWVHYIPLSTGYHELPEMARFLATTERGLQLSERMARESTEWHDKVLRDVDLRIVWLRMLLEYGRMFTPEMTFKL